MISEPEAAAIHKMNAKAPHNFRTADTIVICDAGERTGDLIKFTIVQLQPSLRLKEATPGIAGCAASHSFKGGLSGLYEIDYRLSHRASWENNTVD